MSESEKRELELTIIVTDDGIYVTSIERLNDIYFGNGHINRRFDSVSIDISPLQEEKKNITHIKELSDLPDAEK